MAHSSVDWKGEWPVRSQGVLVLRIEGWSLERPVGLTMNGRDLSEATHHLLQPRCLDDASLVYFLGIRLLVLVERADFVALIQLRSTAHRLRQAQPARTLAFEDEGEHQPK